MVSFQGLTRNGHDENKEMIPIRAHLLMFLHKPSQKIKQLLLVSCRNSGINMHYIKAVLTKETD